MDQIRLIRLFLCISVVLLSSARASRPLADISCDSLQTSAFSLRGAIAFRKAPSPSVPVAELDGVLLEVLKIANADVQGEDRRFERIQDVVQRNGLNLYGQLLTYSAVAMQQARHVRYYGFHALERDNYLPIDHFLWIKALRQAIPLAIRFLRTKDARVFAAASPGYEGPLYPVWMGVMWILGDMWDMRPFHDAVASYADAEAVRQFLRNAGLKPGWFMEIAFLQTVFELEEVDLDGKSTGRFLRWDEIERFIESLGEATFPPAFWQVGVSADDLRGFSKKLEKCARLISPFADRVLMASHGFGVQSTSDDLGRAVLYERFGSSGRLLKVLAARYGPKLRTLQPRDRRYLEKLVVGTSGSSSADPEPLLPAASVARLVGGEWRLVWVVGNNELSPVSLLCSPDQPLPQTIIGLDLLEGFASRQSRAVRVDDEGLADYRLVDPERNTPATFADAALMKELRGIAGRLELDEKHRRQLHDFLVQGQPLQDFWERVEPLMKRMFMSRFYSFKDMREAYETARAETAAGLKQHLIVDGLQGLTLADHILENGMHLKPIGMPIDNEMLILVVRAWIPRLLALRQYYPSEDAALVFKLALSQAMDFRVFDTQIRASDHPEAPKIYPRTPETSMAVAFARMTLGLEEVDYAGRPTGRLVDANALEALLMELFALDGQALKPWSLSRFTQYFGFCTGAATRSESPMESLYVGTHGAAQDVFKRVFQMVWPLVKPAYAISVGVPFVMGSAA